METMETSVVISIAGVLISGLVSFIVASMRIGVYKNKVDTNCTDISDLKKEQKEVRDKVIACETSLREREPLTRRKSPVDLSERGIRTLNESGGKKFVDDNYEGLKVQVEEKTPQTSYDIQEAAKEVIEAIKTDSRVNPIKEYLFKEGMDIEDIVVVLGIYLRNKILTERGINTEDIDKYDPNAKAKNSDHK